MIQRRQNNYLILVISLVALAQCGFALYLPSLSAIAHAFRVNPADVQSTVFLYVLGISFSQWFYGPLSDYYGRRCVALFGLFLFALGAILALVSHSFIFLLIGRSIQGLGMGAVMTVSRAILRDVFKGKMYVKNASKLASVIAISPVIFPVFGGYFQVWWGWKANFTVMLVFSLTVGICWYCFFSESNKKITNEIQIAAIIKNYAHIIASPVFLKHTFCGGLIYAGEVIFLTIAPFLIQQKFNLTSSFYGWLMCIAIAGFVVGSQISSYLANRLRYDALIFIGLCFCLLSVFLFVLTYFFSTASLSGILFPVSIFMLGAGFVYPNTSVGAIGYFPENAGTASALLSSVQGLIAMIATAMILVVQSNSLATLIIGFSVVVLPAFLLAMI